MPGSFVQVDRPYRVLHGDAQPLRFSRTRGQIPHWETDPGRPGGHADNPAAPGAQSNLRHGWKSPRFPSAKDAFDPQQPRDPEGKWTETGAGTVKGLPKGDLPRELRNFAERGDYELTAREPESRGQFESGERYTVQIRLKAPPGIKTAGEGRRQMQYDPEFAAPEIAYPDEPVLRREVARLKPGVASDLEDVLETNPDYMYRGISAEEMEFIRDKEVVQSRGAYNLGPEQEGLTYWSKEVGQAEYYANSFQPAWMKATFEKPAYVVVAKRVPDEDLKHVKGTAENELGVTRAVDRSEIVEIWRGRVAIADTGEMDVRRRSYEEDAPWEAGGGGLPTTQVVWEKVPEAEMFEPYKPPARDSALLYDVYGFASDAWSPDPWANDEALDAWAEWMVRRDALGRFAETAGKAVSAAKAAAHMAGKEAAYYADMMAYATIYAGEHLHGKVGKHTEQLLRSKWHKAGNEGRRNLAKQVVTVAKALPEIIAQESRGELNEWRNAGRAYVATLRGEDPDPHDELDLIEKTFKLLFTVAKTGGALGAGHVIFGETSPLLAVGAIGAALYESTIRGVVVNTVSGISKFLRRGHRPQVHEPLSTRYMRARGYTQWRPPAEKPRRPPHYPLDPTKWPEAERERLRGRRMPEPLPQLPSERPLSPAERAELHRVRSITDPPRYAGDARQPPEPGDLSAAQLAELFEEWFALFADRVANEDIPEDAARGMFAAAEAFLDKDADVADDFDPDQPRNEQGEWTDTGAAASSERTEETARGLRPLDRNNPPAHLAKIRIPPAWRDVQYNPDPDAALQVVGRDTKGRRVALYSAAHAARAAATKFARVDELLKNYRAIVAENDKAKADPARREAAEALELVMKTGLRPGSTGDTRAAKQAYGATTLEGRHVQVRGNAVSLHFTGKKGVDVVLPVRDPALRQMLIARKAKAGRRGRLFNVSDAQLREHAASLGGGGFHPKDFRTRLAAETALREIAKHRVAPKTITAYKKAVREVAKTVAKQLGNTPTVALQSYIPPEVFAQWRAGLPLSPSAQTGADALPGFLTDVLDWPAAHWGDPARPLPDWRSEPDPEDPDDEELPQTPPDVIAALGFDPAAATERTVMDERISWSSPRWVLQDDYDPQQARDPKGRWTKGGGAGKAAPSPAQPVPTTVREPPPHRRPPDAKHPGEGYTKRAYEDANKVIHTDSVADAQRALFEGRKVSLNQPRRISTLLDRLAATAKDMIARGEKAPLFNLCDVSIRGTNLFCAESRNIPRAEMPQLPDDQITPFVDSLREAGYASEQTQEYASFLRATQNQLDGAKVAGTARWLEQNPDVVGQRRLVVSRENYILDGHHFWAAKIGVDARDGVLTNDTKINVVRVDIPIIDLLDRAIKFTGGKGMQAFGQKRASDRKPPALDHWYPLAADAQAWNTEPQARNVA